ncbi:MAG: ABC transporter substrate-binding protein [Dehalococcoidia bacterium]|nr:ABC transporter substrate-binding protein [Dehalococcoidia bacterium]
MRRLGIVAAGLALVVGVFLAACGGDDESAGNGGAPGPVTITLWHSETASNNDSLAWLVERFNASQDQVRVQAVYQGSDDELAAKLIASMRGGSVPTLAWQSEPYTGSMIDSGQVTPLQEYVDRDNYDLSDFAPAAIEYFTVDGTLFALPVGLAVPVMYYNKIPLREAGLDPDQPPRDLDEARSVSEKLVRRDSAGNVTRHGFALEIHPWYMEVIEAGAGELYVNNDNGRAGVATESRFDNEAGRKFFQWWHGMVHDGLALNVGWDPSGAQALLAIGAGKAVMVFSTSAALRSIFDVLATGIEGVDLGVAPIPGIPGRVPEGSPGVYSRSLWIMSARPQEERDAAWEFIKWFVEPEQQAEWFAGSGYLPVRNSAYDLPTAKETIAKYPEFNVPVALFAKTATTTAALGPLIGPFQQVRDAVRGAIESMLSGSASPDDAMETAARNADDAIRQYNERMGR